MIDPIQPIVTLKTKETTIWANHMDKRGLDKIRMGWGTICIFTVIMPALVNIKIMIMVINMIIIIPPTGKKGSSHYQGMAALCLTVTLLCGVYTHPSPPFHSANVENVEL